VEKNKGYGQPCECLNYPTWQWGMYFPDDCKLKCYPSVVICTIVTHCVGIDEFEMSREKVPCKKYWRDK
jgi:hypothetical protein